MTVATIAGLAYGWVFRKASSVDVYKRQIYGR